MFVLVIEILKKNIRLFFNLVFIRKYECWFEASKNPRVINIDEDLLIIITNKINI